VKLDSGVFDRTDGALRAAADWHRGTQARLERLEQSANQLRVPVLFAQSLYHLRVHIELVRNRVARRSYRDTVTDSAATDRLKSGRRTLLIIRGTRAEASRQARVNAGVCTAAPGKHQGHSSKLKWLELMQPGEARRAHRLVETAEGAR